MARCFGVSADTVHSIYHQEITARILKRHHLLKQAGPAYAQRYLAGTDLLQLSFAADLPPCTVARVVVECLPLGISASRLTALLRQPSLLPSLASAQAWLHYWEGQQASHSEHQEAGTGEMASVVTGVPQPAQQLQQERDQQQVQVATGLANSSQQLQLPAAAAAALEAFLARVQQDIERCIECDICASPAADLARHTAGREYEAKLYQCLSDAGIAYWTEDDLRDKGFHKTPDAKLQELQPGVVADAVLLPHVGPAQVPIAVQGRIVNWIDSKATFGDDKTHREQALGQYQKYVNRFGPGLVIYWHGFIRDLSQLQGGEDVLLLDRFPLPQELLTLPRLPLTLGGHPGPDQRVREGCQEGVAAGPAEAQEAAVAVLGDVTVTAA
ncbi:hypothetical protein N2152v2_003736 [Parachlorella kessleri]